MITYKACPVHFPPIVFVRDLGIHYIPFGLMAELESMRYPAMKHLFDEFLVCRGCGLDWNEHQLTGFECDSVFEEKRGKT